MTKQPSIVLAACIAALSSVGIATAQEKQQCSAAMPTNPHGQWWSYRLIDGRKCWYEGKALLSKSLLEWPKQGSVQPADSQEKARAAAEKHCAPAISEAWAAKDSDSFEARWRARVKAY
jgi:hypothetical protein